MNILDTRFGFLKLLLCAGVLQLACTISLSADPVSAFLATWYGALALSAALSAASFGLQILFRPKPKPQDKNRLQGDVQFTSVGEDIFINEPYGGGMPDGISGIRLGGVIFYASEIRKVVVNVPGGSGGGGGKGAPKSPPTKEYHYYIDLAIMCGRGPLRVRQIKAQTDLIYQSFTPVINISGTTYEAEDRTDDSGAVTDTADVDMSGGFRTDLDQNEWIEWDDVACTDDSAAVELNIVYKSTEDVEIEFTVNGTTTTAVLPDSFGLRQNVNLPQTLIIGTSNVIRIENLTDATLSIDRIVVGFAPIVIDPTDPTDPCYLSGVRDLNWINPEPTYDYVALRDVYLPDDRGCRQFNYQANPNALGEVSTVTSNGNIRIYPGNKTQLPDPLLQAYFESRFGPGSTPAFRGRGYVVLENFEVTKYGTVPNFTFVVEHETINSLGELFSSLSLRAGLTEDEFDFSALDAVPLRGYCITQREAPAKSIEILSRVFDVDVVENIDGQIAGVVPSETLAATIPLEDLDMVELPADDAASPPNADSPLMPVVTQIRDETDLPGFLDVSFFDAQEDWDTRNASARRDVGASERKANIETGVVLTPTEAKKFADRDLHKQYVEKDGVVAKPSHKYTYVQPTDLIQLTDVDGSTPRMRVKGIAGWLPGALEFRGASRDAVEFPPRLFVTAQTSPVVPSLHPPAPIIGTFIDLAIFGEEQTAGFYVAACLTDQHYKWAGAGLYRAIEGPDWEALDGIPNQATMGRTVEGTEGTLGDVPGGWTAGDWDTVNTLTIDNYYGELETLTDDQVLEGRNYLVVGNEIVQFANATRDNGFPRRWVIDRFQRKLRGTAADSHAESERIVLYTAAWRWLEQDPSIAGTARTYKFVGSGGDLESASSVDFNWQGRTQYNLPIYTTVDNGVPILGTDPPVTSEEGGFWTVAIQRPIQNGFSADIAEVRVRKTGDDSVLRYVDIGNTVISPPILAPVDNSKVDYRWRNKYRLGGSDGWSAWSAVETVFVGSVPTPPTIIIGGDPPGPGEFQPIGCFAAGTLVLMADWSEKRIELIRPGDYVMAWLQGGRLMPARVRAFSGAMNTVYQDLGLIDDRLEITPLHPFCSDWERKVKACDMLPGQKLRQYDRGWGLGEVVTNSAVELDEARLFWNWEIESWHTYMVRGATGKPWKAVHNKSFNEF